MEFVLGLLSSMLGNPVVQAALIGVLIVLAGMIVKKTKNKKDDMIFDIVRGAIFNSFNMAEKAIPDDSENKTIRKIDEALKAFNTKIVDALGRNASKPELEQAKALWSEMAFELKKK